MKSYTTVEYKRVDWKYIVKTPENWDQSWDYFVTYQTLVKGREGCVVGEGAVLAQLTEDGELTIHAGYGWDGPSGPALDTPSFMDASLAHDCLYQMIEEGTLPMKPCRRQADKTMRRIAKAHGMGWFRRLYTFLGVRAGGKGHARK
jgi:hypothetical protein